MIRNIPTNVVSVAPVLEPIFLDEVKEYCFIVSDSTYDRRIEKDFIPTARDIVQRLTNRSLITQTRIQYYDYLPYEIFFRYGPVQSVTSITYKDTAEAQQTLTSSLYTVDTASVPARINIGYDESYPTAICDTKSVAVTAVCGYGLTAASVPAIYKSAMRMLCAHWFNNPAIACGDYTNVFDALMAMLAIEGATVEYA